MSRSGVPMHDKFKLARAQQQFSRLMGLCEQRSKELRENPEPYLAMASAEISRHRHLLNEVRAALLGSDEFLQDPGFVDRFESPTSILLRRQQKALALLEAADRETVKP